MGIGIQSRTSGASDGNIQVPKVDFKAPKFQQPVQQQNKGPLGGPERPVSDAIRKLCMQFEGPVSGNSPSRNLGRITQQSGGVITGTKLSSQPSQRKIELHLLLNQAI